MPVLHPFIALHSAERLLFIPGEENPPAFNPALLSEEREPALFFYRQQFAGTVREGIMGVRERKEAVIHPHEETEPARVAACREELRRSGVCMSSVFLWCAGAPLKHPGGAAWCDVQDRFGCQHEIWRVTNPRQIAEIQGVLRDRELFIADGHHRFAAGWQLATIQIRTEALRTRAAHRLVRSGGNVHLDGLQRVGDLRSFWAATPRGAVRFGVILPHQPILGIELACDEGQRNLTVLHERLLRNAIVEPVRDMQCARHAVDNGRAQMAFLVEPLTVENIEDDARRGILLPPKSTDFYPKLAGGLVMCRHQKETFMPPMTNRPGVRHPSS